MTTATTPGWFIRRPTRSGAHAPDPTTPIRSVAGVGRRCIKLSIEGGERRSLHDTTKLEVLRTSGPHCAANSVLPGQNSDYNRDEVDQEHSQ
jgi:hypothetical protein